MHRPLRRWQASAQDKQDDDDWLASMLGFTSTPVVDARAGSAKPGHGINDTQRGGATTSAGLPHHGTLGGVTPASLAAAGEASQGSRGRVSGDATRGSMSDRPGPTTAGSTASSTPSTSSTQAGSFATTAAEGRRLLADLTPPLLDPTDCKALLGESFSAELFKEMANEDGHITRSQLDDLAKVLCSILPQNRSMAV